ncbi:hypothetical protein ACFW0H_07690 [Pseudomonas sp. CR3202]|uniref:hypothetical protein n=1 Tax=Pseudomonas sp. CR3202 TaxID=3351532 RepID=UPI003BF1AD41
MKILLVVGFFLVFFLVTAFAAAPTTMGDVSIDEYYERSQRSMEDALALANKVFEMERGQEGQDGDAYKMYFADVQALTESVRYNLRMAAEGGHPVAPYLLANILVEERITDPEKRKARDGEVCRLYQVSADRKLLAGALALFNRCNESFLRFQAEGPEIQKMIEDLENSLEVNDPSKDYYPLPSKQSICFREDKIPDLAALDSFSKVMAAVAPAMLTYEQFKADAYYLLAMMPGGNNRSDILEKIERVNFAKSLGCNDEFKLQQAFEKDLSTAQ